MNKAKWISLGSLPAMMPAIAPTLNGSIYFRRSFTITNPIKEAVLSICALGLGEYSINGVPVTEDVLCTPYTQYDKRIIYQKYDVTSLLTVGENVIGTYAGNGFYNNNMETWNDIFAPWRDNPKLLASLAVTYVSGEEEIIRTDTSWKAVKGPSVYNHMRQGEIHDASLRQPGFDKPGFDDSAWENAVIAHEPGGILETTDMPPIRVIRTLKPISCKDGIYDFGENISGWAKITATGKKGQQLRLIFDEKLNPDGSFRTGKDRNIALYSVIENKELCQEDIFILSGNEKETFRPSFVYHGFRYVKAENAPVDFSIEAEVVHTDLKQIGSFESSDDMLNKIHKACVQATLSNYVGIPTDCPHREQNGWTGDAQLSSRQSVMNFDMERAYAKWLRDYKDAQRPNGQLPGIIPCAGWGYNWGSGPAWDSAIILIPWNTYLTTRSTAIIEDMWENIVRYMDYFDRMATDNIACFGLGDWCPVREPICPTELTDTAYYYADTLIVGKMAQLIGKDANRWFEKAAAIRQSWRDNFWNIKERSHLEGFQTYWACAIYQGLLDKDEIPAAAARLADLVIANDYHIDCGILGTSYIFTALSENGYMDVLYRMVTNPTYPSYAYWINSGCTALCESWNMTSSDNHHMYSEVDAWLYHYVGGIKWTEEGLLIQPMPLKAVDRVCVTHAGISVSRNGKEVTIATPVEATIIIGNQHIQAAPGEYTYLLP